MSMRHDAHETPEGNDKLPYTHEIGVYACLYTTHDSLKLAQLQIG